MKHIFKVLEILSCLVSYFEFEYEHTWTKRTERSALISARRERKILGNPERNIGRAHTLICAQKGVLFFTKFDENHLITKEKLH
jgi:hypothetical protein